MTTEPMTELPQVSREELIEMMRTNPGPFFDLLYHKAIPNLRTLLENLKEALPCAQLQFMLIDAQSIHHHLVDLNDNGPKPAHEETPLHESEWPEELHPEGGLREAIPEVQAEAAPEFT